MVYVYIVECADGSLYTGWTTNVKRRLAVHNSGKGGSYTRSRMPVKLAYWEPVAGKNEALSREAAIKKLSRQEKQQLIDKRNRQRLPD